MLLRCAGRPTRRLPTAGELRSTSFGDSGEVVYYHSNTLYSVYALSDGSENVVERCRSAKPSYGSFAGGETPPMMEGEPVVPDADPASEADTPSLKLRRASWSADADAASDVSNPYAFTARRLDAESGLMQYRHRYYSTTLGRFTSRDAWGYRDGPNLYQYVSSSPRYKLDPFGLLCVTDIPGPSTKEMARTYLHCLEEIGDWYDRCKSCAEDKIDACLEGADDAYECCMDLCASDDWREDPSGIRNRTCAFICGRGSGRLKDMCYGEYAAEQGTCAGTYAGFETLCVFLHKGVP